jgi:hypothetical protein
MSVVSTFTCDACGATGLGEAGDYLYPDPPIGWVWFWGSGMSATGPHACSRACWQRVGRSSDGRLLLPDSHEQRVERHREREARQRLERIDPLAANLTPLRETGCRLASYVYFIQRGVDGPIKIGYSRKPKSRLSQLQSAFPETLRMLGVIPGDKAKERALHDRFDGIRVKGEWFAPDRSLIALIKANAKAP